MTNEQRIEAIRARIGAENERAGVPFEDEHVADLYSSLRDDNYTEAASDLLANAPADLVFLLAEIDRLKAEVAKLSRVFVVMRSEYDGWGAPQLVTHDEDEARACAAQIVAEYGEHRSSIEMWEGGKYVAHDEVPEGT